MRDPTSYASDSLRVTLELPSHLAVKLERARVKMGYQSRGTAIVNLLELLLTDHEEAA